MKKTENLDTNSKYIQAKETHIQEILNDDTLTKLQKLESLKADKLFDVQNYMSPSPFDDWGNELRQTIINEQFSNKPQVEVEVDECFFDIFDRYIQRHEVCSFIDFIDKIECDLEDLEDLDESDEFEDSEADKQEPTFVVAYSRNPKYTLEKTATQIIDCVYDFCVKNRVWGFKYDW